MPLRKDTPEVPHICVHCWMGYHPDCNSIGCDCSHRVKYPLKNGVRHGPPSRRPASDA
jgi:hypothetical protein